MESVGLGFDEEAYTILRRRDDPLNHSPAHYNIATLFQELSKSAYIDVSYAGSDEGNSTSVNVSRVSKASRKKRNRFYVVTISLAKVIWMNIIPTKISSGRGRVGVQRRHPDMLRDGRIDYPVRFAVFYGNLLHIYFPGMTPYLFNEIGQYIIVKQTDVRDILLANADLVYVMPRFRLAIKLLPTK